MPMTEDNAVGEVDEISDVLDELIAKIEMVENAKKNKVHQFNEHPKPNQLRIGGRLSKVKRMNSVMTSHSSSTSSSEEIVDSVKSSPRRRKSMLRERQLNHYKDISSSESSLDDTAFKEKVLNNMRTVSYTHLTLPTKA